MNAKHAQSTQPDERQDAVVIPFPGAPAVEPEQAPEVDPNHWSRRLPAGNGGTVSSGSWLIYASVVGGITTAVVIRVVSGGAL